jgi:TetR/AcrR family transcriptional regulator, mexJK operon transcriptional repressor
VRKKKASTKRGPRHSPEQIQVVLERTSAALKKGKTVAEACHELGISAASYYRWRAEAAGGKGRVRQVARERTRTEIIAAAKTVFLREGRAIGLDGVAKAAKVTRQTLYNLFGSKERLFRAVVHAIYARILDPILHVDSKGDVRETLIAYGRQSTGLALNPDTIGLLRLTVAEIRDFPDLGKILYSTTSRQGPVLAAYFRAQIDAGRLRPFDPIVGAEAFIGALTSHPRYRALVNVGIDSEEHKEALLQFTVDTFLGGVSSPG